MMRSAARVQPTLVGLLGFAIFSRYVETGRARISGRTATSLMLFSTVACGRNDTIDLGVNESTDTTGIAGTTGEQDDTTEATTGSTMSDGSTTGSTTSVASDTFTSDVTSDTASDMGSISSGAESTGTVSSETDAGSATMSTTNGDGSSDVSTGSVDATTVAETTGGSSVGESSTSGSTGIDPCDDTTGSECDPGVKVAMFGHQSLNVDAQAVLELVLEEGAEAILHLGNDEHLDDANAWDAMLTNVLGPDFPVLAVIGKQEPENWPAYQQKLEARLAMVPGVSCAGDLGVKAACNYRGLLFLLSGAGLSDAKHDAYMTHHLAASDAMWRICAWHTTMNEMQTGTKENESGWYVYEACRQGGAIIATAHEQAYSRTWLMEDFPAKTIASMSNTMQLERGRAIAFVSGLGGHSIHPQVRDDPWWASVYTSSQNAQFGALFCAFGVGGQPDHASCYFKTIDGDVPDTFELVSAVDLTGACPWPDGHADYCRDCGPCPDGTGNCQNDGQCLAGSVCSADVGDDYGYTASTDVCTSTCAWSEGHSNYCLECGPCRDGEGDCDMDIECVGGTTCQMDVGAVFGYEPQRDVCLAMPVACPWPHGHSNYCRDCGPCPHGVGDCDNDAECAMGATCQLDVGETYGYVATVDVCVM